MMTDRIFRGRRAILAGIPLSLAGLEAQAGPVAAASSVAGMAAATDLEILKQGGVLRIAVPNLKAAPFFTEGNDPKTSIDISLGMTMAQALDVRLEVDRRPATFNDAVDLLASGEVHLALCKLSRTLPRAQRIIYSRPYASLTHALFLNRLKFAQLVGTRKVDDVVRSFDGELGILAKSSYVDFAHKDFPGAALREYPSWPEVFRAVREGEVHAGYSDSYTINRLFAADPSMSIVARSITLTDKVDGVAIGLPPSAPHLAAFVNLFLELHHGAAGLSVKDLVSAFGVDEGTS